MSNLHHVELPFLYKKILYKSVHLACGVKRGYTTATPNCFNKKEDSYFASVWPLVMEAPYSINRAHG